MPLLPWREQSTTHLQQIEKWHKQFPNCNWGVDCGKSGLIVLDVDNKNGANGTATLQAHPILPRTFSIVTPNAGRHFYFRGEHPSKRDFAPGLDLKANGGYVVLFGSTIPSGEYALAEDVPAVAAPRWLLDLAGRSTIARTGHPEAWTTDPDKPEYIEWAINWLEDEAPESVQGRNGDDTLVHKVLFTLRDNGISEDTAVRLLLEHYNDAKAFPQWTEQEITTKAANAYRYASLPPASATLEVRTTEAATAFAAAPLGRIKPFPVSSIDLSALPPRRWIVQHRLLRGYATGLIAPGGVGKSTFAFLDALAVATGRDLTGDTVVERGPVVLYNAEDPLSELQMRFAAVASYYGVPLSGLPVYLVSGRDHKVSVASCNPRTAAYTANTADVDALAELVRGTGAILFTGDPFIRLHDVPENDNVAVDKVVEVFTDLADQLQIGVHLVHHTRKMGAAGGEGDAETARGASAFTSALRLVHTLSVMSEADAKTFGMDQQERKWYVRLDDAKLNLAPPVDKIRWYKRVSVRLENGENIGTLERVELQPKPKAHRLLSGAADLAAAAAVITPDDELVLLQTVVERMTEANPLEERTAGTVLDSIRRRFIETDTLAVGNVELTIHRPKMGKKGYYLSAVALDRSIVPPTDVEAELLG